MACEQWNETELNSLNDLVQYLSASQNSSYFLNNNDMKNEMMCDKLIWIDCSFNNVKMLPQDIIVN